MTNDRLTNPLTDAEVAKLREQFPILGRKGRDGKPIVYLDSSATSQKPSRVIEAEAEFYRKHNAAVNRGTHMLGDESTGAFDMARETVANFIGARPEEVVWTKNATEALNLIAYSMSNASSGMGGKEAERFRVGPGDKIVATRAEHHANLLPWQELAARTGAEFAFLDLEPDGRIDLDTLDVIDERVKLVAFTHVSNVTGAISPVDEIVAAARKVGALIVLDTCQSSAHLPINVEELGVDFAVFSSHKMLGPTGVGALWARYELLEAMPPVLVGGSVIANVTMEKGIYLPPPAKFEAGSQPVAQAVGWAEALNFLSEVGMDRLAAYEERITRALIDVVSSVDGVKIIGPANADNRLGVVAFTVDGIHPHDVGQYLDSESVAVRVGHHCAIPLHRFFGVRSSNRASASLTTTLDEVHRFGEALAHVRGFFGGM
ncbi:MAG: SufS family cysteine desulfurase [Actinomycetaceae bacterium]|nr:SufS family cysteine desulfurase [Actinomycetaceae bacterium]